MRKEEFLKELEALLQDISEQERLEALQYYRDYFDDAGSENEGKILEELGSPAKVAHTIKHDLGETEGEFTENGFRDPRFEDSQSLSPKTASKEQNKEQHPAKGQKTNGWKIAFLILVCLLLMPILLPIGIAVLAVLAVLFIAIVAVAVGIGAAALALLIAGIAVVIVGIGKALLMPAAGVALAGVGLLLLAVGILAVVLIVWCCVKFLPWLIRGIVKLLKALFRKRAEAV